MKRIFSIVLIVFVALSLTICTSADFTTPSDWAVTEVAQAASLGLVPTNLQQNYTDNITREEFCDTLILLVQKTNENLISQTQPVTFTDTDNQNVAILGGIGIVSGVGDDQFNPKGSITRQEAAVILARAGEKLSGSKISKDFTFDDLTSIADWAMDGVSYVTAAKVMNGTDTGFDPLGGYTREQTFATVLRLHTFLTNKITAEQPKTKKEDLDATWDDTAITLTFVDHIATITDAGTYIVSGNIENGQILIDNQTDELVRLVLDGINLTNPTGTAIYAKACDKLLIILADGTQNTITDGGANFVYADEVNQEPNAAIWAKNDLTIGGGGSLTVNAGFNNGVQTKDDLLIANGSVSVNALNHALKGKDSVTVLDGNITLATTQGDGIQTDNDIENGNIFIRGGILNIAVADDGIHADNTLEISDGQINITKSYEGLEAAIVKISGGDINIASDDDGINAAGGSGNGNNAQWPMGGRPTGQGQPGQRPTDDNTSGQFPMGERPTDGTSPGERPPMDGQRPTDGTFPPMDGSFPTDQMPPTDWAGQNIGRDNFATNSPYSLNISGGNITVFAGFDCLDSNGALNISGGHLVLSSGIHGGGDGALDADGQITITGGTIIYDGSNTRGSYSADSTQSYVYHATAIKTGDVVVISKNGQEIIGFTTTLDMAGLAVSTPDITAGESYYISINGSSASAIAGTGGMSGMVGGRPGGMQQGNQPNERPNGNMR